MVATSTSSKTIDLFIKKLEADYPDIKFKTGAKEHWSPKLKTITYNPHEKPLNFKFGLLHELAHALLGHTTYGTDFELLKLESQAWDLAAKLGKKYGVKIDSEYIQICLDTYRDWLHRRSTCPVCGTHVLQSNIDYYHCYNCQTDWRVSNERFVRPYRRKT